LWPSAAGARSACVGSIGSTMVAASQRLEAETELDRFRDAFELEVEQT
jgi:hypothetical protein